MQVFVDRSFAGIQGIGLIDTSACGAARVNAPMIEHTGYVDDLPGINSLNATKCKVIILRTFEAFSQPTQLMHELRSIHTQMADHVVRIKKVLIPFAFEIGL